jgi:hypothetical protein
MTVLIEQKDVQDITNTRMKLGAWMLHYQGDK